MIARIGQRILVTACVGCVIRSSTSTSTMLSSTDVYFYSDVDSNSCLELATSIELLDSKMMKLHKHLDAQKNIPIDVHIHSSGGSLTSGLYMYDFMKKIQTPIHTHIEGLAASSATLLSVAGDHRTMTKHSMMLIHEPSLKNIKSNSKFTDTRDQFVNMKKYMNAILDIYLEQTNIEKKDKIAKKKERVRFRALLLHARREYETKARSIYLRSAAIGREC